MFPLALMAFLGLGLVARLDAQMNIVEKAQSVDTLSTLVTALTAADLVDTLSGAGPFTVFAPTNDAFAAIQETVDALLEDPTALAAVLKYHVVSGKVMAADIVDGQVILTVNGAKLTAKVDGDGVSLKDSTGAVVAKVTGADVEVTNGVVHIIDKVMVPPAGMNIVEKAQSVDTLSTLVTAVVAADLVDTLSGAGPFTVFAPTNDAFAAIQATVDALLEDPTALAAVLKYHVVSGKVMAADIVDGQVIPTVHGAKLTAKVNGNGVSLKDSTGAVVAQVTGADVEVTNGVVHIVNQVMVPPAGMNIVEKAQSVDTLSTLVTAVVAADLVDTLSGAGPFTVFAPTNDAFAAIQETVDALLEDPTALAAVLKYHVVSGKVMAADIVDGQVIPTVNGAKLTAKVDGDGVSLQDSTGAVVAKVTGADVEVTNGVIHVIDKVMVPPKVDGGSDAPKDAPKNGGSDTPTDTPKSEAVSGASGVRLSRWIAITVLSMLSLSKMGSQFLFFALG